MTADSPKIAARILEIEVQVIKRGHTEMTLADGETKTMARVTLKATDGTRIMIPRDDEDDLDGLGLFMGRKMTLVLVDRQTAVEDFGGDQ